MVNTFNYNVEVTENSSEPNVLHYNHIMGKLFFGFQG